MNKQYQFATSSPTNFLQFIVDTQYPHMINRAIGNKLVNSSVGEENLYYALLAAAKVQSPIYNDTLNFQLQTSPSLTNEANEAIEMLQAKGRQSGPLMRQAAPAYCAANFTGPLTNEQQLTCASFANGGQSGWNSDNTSTAINVAGQIFGTITSWFNGNDNQPPAVGDNSTTDNNNNNNNNSQTDYMPYVFGGAALLIIIIVAVLLYLKSRKG